MSIFGSKEARIPMPTPGFDELSGPSFPRVVRNQVAGVNDAVGPFAAADRELQDLREKCLRLEEENHSHLQQKATLVGELQAKARENERLQHALDDRDGRLITEMTLAEHLRTKAIGLQELADHFSASVSSFVKSAMSSANSAKAEQPSLPLEDEEPEQEPVPAFLTKGPAEA